MKSETLLEVVSELIGYIDPYGDTAIDKIRYENQEKLINLVTEGIESLINNSKYVYRLEYSMFEIGDKAYRTLEELHKKIGLAIKE